MSWQSPQEILPPGWRSVISPDGSKYYTDGTKSQWEHPGAHMSAPSPPEAPPPYRPQAAPLHYEASYAAPCESSQSRRGNSFASSTTTGGGELERDRQMSPTARATQILLRTVAVVPRDRSPACARAATVLMAFCGRQAEERRTASMDRELQSVDTMINLEVVELRKKREVRPRTPAPTVCGTCRLHAR
jgi:hypothetical protein